MIELDYRDNNPRWRNTGLFFSSWENYSKTLGYLSNPDHYYENGGNISIVIERNDEQGAWGKEGRILYYGDQEFLKSYLTDLFDSRTVGVGAITARINSTKYIQSLKGDYHFNVVSKSEQTTLYLFPPHIATILFSLKASLDAKGVNCIQIINCLKNFTQFYHF